MQTTGRLERSRDTLGDVVRIKGWLDTKPTLGYRKGGVFFLQELESDKESRNLDGLGGWKSE